MNQRTAGIRYGTSVLVGLVLILCGCQQPTGLSPISLASEINPQPANASNPVTAAFLTPAGNYSMVTVRTRPDLAQSTENRAILCSAPSPDWATAIAGRAAATDEWRQDWRTIGIARCQ
jgi:hypothetical protein